MFYVLYMFGSSVLRFRLARSFLLILSIALAFLIGTSGNLLALDLDGENHFDANSSISENYINLGDESSYIVNEGSIMALSNNKARIDLGTNPSSFVQQVDGTMDANIRINADG